MATVTPVQLRWCFRCRRPLPQQTYGGEYVCKCGMRYTFAGGDTYDGEE